MSASAEQRVVKLLGELVLEVQTQTDALRREMALFALIAWVVALRKLNREFRRNRLVRADAVLSSVEALLLTRFRSYEKRLEAAIEGIILASSAKFGQRMDAITGQVRFVKTPKIKARDLTFLGMTLRDNFTLLLRNFQKSLFLQVRRDTLMNQPISHVSGEASVKAEDLFDWLGGQWPESQKELDQASAYAAEALPKMGPVRALSAKMHQLAGDFTFSGFIDTLQPLFTDSAHVAGVAIQVIWDNTTSEICRAFYGGKWDLSTKKPLPDSRVDIDFPGLPPYHNGCRSLPVPIFHENITFLSKAKTSGTVEL